MNAIHCFGEALIDFHGAARGVAPVFTAHPGGAPANVAVAVAKLGGKAAFIGMLGKDMFGDLLLGDLQQAGVDVTHVRRTDAANTALAFVSHAAGGERSFSFYRPPSADLLFREADFDAAVFAPGAIFHAGSVCMTDPAAAATTLAGMRRARDGGMLVSFDVNLRPALWPRGEDPAPTVWRALELADFVKLSAEEFRFLASSADAEDRVLDRLWKAHARLVLVTDGPKGARWFAPDARGACGAFHVEALDTTGAGDAFTAGCLFRFARSAIDVDALAALTHDAQRMAALLRFASACGALAATRAGSFTAMPTLAAVTAFLEDQP